MFQICCFSNRVYHTMSIHRSYIFWYSDPLWCTLMETFNLHSHKPLIIYFLISHRIKKRASPNSSLKGSIILPLNNTEPSNETVLQDAHKHAPGEPNPQPPACRAVHLLQTVPSPQPLSKSQLNAVITPSGQNISVMHWSILASGLKGTHRHQCISVY